ncbi:maleylacetoacetate isomerase [Kordiimonas sediminis]|uniref:Maleylacetoacetate isomerase n=1 Tax=Kordiimonas sediminis TaxID=1735581 RepID=A0A919AUK9_9PROT|nr:maleylacetoacetate isomerase [Kordiimonas sediminis]GHF26889.1 maleylacetoacetate isomerase [Kordiimonas sediminis]
MSRILYGYYRSSAAYRVRIALNLKGLDYEHVSVNLKPGEDGQKQAEYVALNPQGRVPFFIDGDVKIAQSPAVLEYLEEVYPETPLLPEAAADRAFIRQIVNIIACDIHPLNNLSVLQRLKGDFSASDQDIAIWYHHWIKEGFQAIEKLSKNTSGEFLFGDDPTLADVYLLPQIWNAERFKTALDDFPTLLSIRDNANKLQAFIDAAPENQPDTPAI